MNVIGLISIALWVLCIAGIVAGRMTIRIISCICIIGITALYCSFAFNRGKRAAGIELRTAFLDPMMSYADDLADRTRQIPILEAKALGLRHALESYMRNETTFARAIAQVVAITDDEGGEQGAGGYGSSAAGSPSPQP